MIFKVEDEEKRDFGGGGKAGLRALGEISLFNREVGAQTERHV